MDRQPHATSVAVMPPSMAQALACPFPVRRHPEHERLSEATRKWLVMLPAGTRLIAHRYDQVHAQMWAAAEWKRLWLANRLLLHMWWIDDILDDPARKDAGDIAATHREVLMQRSTGRNDGSHVLAELMNEVYALMPESWIRRVRSLYIAYLDTSLAHREGIGTVPTLEEYLRLRPLMGGMYYATALSELAYDCPLPRRLSANGWSYDLTLRVNHICCWANDLYAYDREVSKGDPFNLVAILHAHHGLTLSRAVETVTNLTNSELAVFSLLSVPAADISMSRYLQGLKDMLAAILSWSAHTLRYA